MAIHWNGTESRWGDRVQVNIPVEVSTEASSRTEGCISNLSLSGALVKTVVDLGLHSIIDVRVPLASTSQRAEAVTAYVSRKLDEGVGIEWCSFAPAIVKHLLRTPSVSMPR